MIHGLQKHCSGGTSFVLFHSYPTFTHSQPFRKVFSDSPGMLSCLVFGAGQIQAIVDFLSYFPLYPFISHRVPSRFFAFLRAVSHSHRAPIPYLHIVFIHLRDIFAYFSYRFFCLIPFTPSLPVTFLHIPSHSLAFLSLGLAQSV